MKIVEVQHNTKLHGMALAIMGPLLWGFSGIVAQYLFGNYQMSPQWLVCLRMLGAGALLVLFGALTTGHKVLDAWRKPASMRGLIIFSLIGMLPAQLTYFMAIQHSNAATATILQFLSPALIIVFLAVHSHRLPSRINTISVILAILGTALLVTGGNFSKLNIAPAGLIWGLLTALSTAIYTLYPRKLLKEFGAVAIVGWSMLLGGLVFLPTALRYPLPQLDVKGVALVSFVVLFGTLFAYLFVLQSLRFIAPTITSLLGAFEPLTSTLLTVLFFHIAFGLPELAGTVLILGTTILQAAYANTQTRNRSQNLRS